ncbi:hypothetical protein ACSSS7_005354 [Eimeria intestinalis]
MTSTGASEVRVQTLRHIPPSSMDELLLYRRAAAARLHSLLLVLLLLLLLASSSSPPRPPTSPSSSPPLQTISPSLSPPILSSSHLLAWFPNPLDSLAGLGFLTFASAAPCAVNVCINGTCYEHNSAQICVCEVPFRGPTCEERASLCSNDCGIRQTSGIDCSSALCSLGSCTDTENYPFFKCDCGDFFSGSNCEIPTNPCTSVINPCGHGTCSFAPGRGSGTVTCTCDDDWRVAAGSVAVISRWGSSEVVLNPPSPNRHQHQQQQQQQRSIIDCSQSIAAAATAKRDACMHVCSCCCNCAWAPAPAPAGAAIKATAVTPSAAACALCTSSSSSSNIDCIS